jgi:hypothetical protein
MPVLFIILLPRPDEDVYRAGYHSDSCLKLSGRSLCWPPAAPRPPDLHLDACADGRRRIPEKTHLYRESHSTIRQVTKAPRSFANPKMRKSSRAFKNILHIIIIFFFLCIHARVVHSLCVSSLLK